MKRAWQQNRITKEASLKFSWADIKTHQGLMEEAYDLWQKSENAHWNNHDFIANLPSQAHKDAVILGNLNYQVGNGGFEQWFLNGYGQRDWAYLVNELLPKIGTPAALEVAKLVEKAYSTKRNEQRGGYDPYYADEDEEDFESAWLDESMDTEYYKLEDQFMIDVENYLQSIAKAGTMNKQALKFSALDWDLADAHQDYLMNVFNKEQGRMPTDGAEFQNWITNNPDVLNGLESDTEPEEDELARVLKMRDRARERMNGKLGSRKFSDGYGTFEWPELYLKDGMIVDVKGNQAFADASQPMFSSPEEAENWLIENNHRGNVIGDYNMKQSSIKKKAYSDTFNYSFPEELYKQYPVDALRRFALNKIQTASDFEGASHLIENYSTKVELATTAAQIFKALAEAFYDGNEEDIHYLIEEFQHSNTQSSLKKKAMPARLKNVAVSDLKSRNYYRYKDEDMQNYQDVKYDGIQGGGYWFIFPRGWGRALSKKEVENYIFEDNRNYKFTSSLKKKADDTGTGISDNLEPFEDRVDVNVQPKDSINRIQPPKYVKDYQLGKFKRNNTDFLEWFNENKEDDILREDYFNSDAKRDGISFIQWSKERFEALRDTMQASQNNSIKKKADGVALNMLQALFEDKFPMYRVPAELRVLRAKASESLKELVNHIQMLGRDSTPPDFPMDWYYSNTQFATPNNAPQDYSNFVTETRLLLQEIIDYANKSVGGKEFYSNMKTTIKKISRDRTGVTILRELVDGRPYRYGYINEGGDYIELRGHKEVSKYGTIYRPDKNTPVKVLGYQNIEQSTDDLLVANLMKKSFDEDGYDGLNDGVNDATQKPAEGFIPTSEGQMEPDDVVDYLTYINYAFNREITPDVSPERWANIYGPKAEAMERRYQKEKNAGKTFTRQDITKVLIKEAVDVSDEIPPMGWDSTEPGTPAGSGAPKQPLQSLQDEDAKVQQKQDQGVLYDSTKDSGPQFQTTISPKDKSVTVKFIDSPEQESFHKVLEDKPTADFDQLPKLNTAPQGGEQPAPGQPGQEPGQFNEQEVPVVF